MTKSKNRFYHLWYVFIFLFLYLWFTQIHPLMVYDSDDWSFLSYIRNGYPDWGSWNPARVFPETFMPLVCSIGAHFLYPITGDYLGSITIACAFTVSVFITVYVYCFTRMIERIFQLSEELLICVSSLFVMFHFLAMRSEECANQYLFYCWDLTCYFFYLIPSLLCCSLVMHMTCNPQFEDFRKNGNPVKRGFFLLAVYLSIFSNLPASGILAAFAGCQILTGLYFLVRKESTLKQFLESRFLHMGILLGWLVSAVFELFGGRAVSFANGESAFGSNLYQIIDAFSHPTVYCGKMFLVLTFGILLAVFVITLLLLVKKESAVINQFLSVFICFAICACALLVYMVILMATIDWMYVQRSEYLFGLFFYLFLLVLCSLCLILKKYPRSVVLLPIVLFVTFTGINTVGQTFKESNMRNIDSSVIISVGNDLVQQFIDADQNGIEHLQLQLPVSDKDLNWPLFDGENGFAIADTLYEHGVTGRRIHFTGIATMEMNEKHHLPIVH